MKLDLTTIIENFNHLSDQVRYSALVGVVFLVILLDVFFVALPQMNSIADINDRIKKMSEDTQRVSTDNQRIGLLRKNLEKQRDQYKSLSVKVRAIQEVPAILSGISSIANEYGVKIDQLVPEKIQQEALSSSTEGKYYSLPVVIRAHCGYHMFGRFLSKLEDQNLYFIMKNFIIQNDDKDPNSRLFSLTITMVLVDKSSLPKKI